MKSLVSSKLKRISSSLRGSKISVWLLMLLLISTVVMLSLLMTCQLRGALSCCYVSLLRLDWISWHWLWGWVYVLISLSIWIYLLIIWLASYILSLVLKLVKIALPIPFVTFDSELLKLLMRRRLTVWNHGRNLIRLLVLRISLILLAHTAITTQSTPSTRHSSILLSLKILIISPYSLRLLLLLLLNLLDWGTLSVWNLLLL